MSNVYVDGVETFHIAELPKLNIDLLRDCVKWVRRQVQDKFASGDPLWLQNTWAIYLTGDDTVMTDDGEVLVEEHEYCGSAYCVNGYGLMISGCTKTIKQLHEELGVEKLLEMMTIEAKEELGDPKVLNLTVMDPNMVGFDGNLIFPGSGYIGLNWITAGAAVFGLTREEASALFEGTNDAQDIEEIAWSIADSRGLDLWPEDAA